MARTRDLAAASTRLLFVGVLAMLVVCCVALQTQRKHHAHRHYRGLHGAKGRNTPSLKLSDDLTLTQAQVDELKTYLASKNKWFTPGDQTFWHWTTFENCLRWVRRLFVLQVCMAYHGDLFESCAHTSCAFASPVALLVVLE